jgi:hypothetical protein
MHERALRKVLLIQSIEETDRTGTALPLAERIEATRAVLGKSPPSPETQPEAPLSTATEWFLIRRADILLASLRSRSPGVDRVLKLAGGATPFERLVLFGAFLLGLPWAFLDRHRGIDIFALPLVALILWNLLIYVSLWRPGPPRQTAFTRVYARSVRRHLENVLTHSSHFNAPLVPGLSRFAGDWCNIAPPLFAARARRLLHLAAVLVAVGFIAGDYVRAEIFRADAGWYANTMLGPQMAHAALTVLYWPALLVTGIDSPSTEVIRQLCWTSPQTGGGEATFWIHLMAWTAGVYIVIPRLLAVLGSTFTLWRLSRQFVPPPGLASYVRNVVALERYQETGSGE